MEIAVNAIVGALILLALGWLKLDINHLNDSLSARIDHLAERIEVLAERVSRIEGRLDEREHH